MPERGATPLSGLSEGKEPAGVRRMFQLLDVSRGAAILPSHSHEADLKVLVSTVFSML